MKYLSLPYFFSKYLLSLFFYILVVEVLEYSNRNYFKLLNDKHAWRAQTHTHTDSHFNIWHLYGNMGLNTFCKDIKLWSESLCCWSPIYSIFIEPIQMNKSQHLIIKKLKKSYQLEMLAFIKGLVQQKQVLNDFPKKGT